MTGKKLLFDFDTGEEGFAGSEADAV